MPQVQIEIEVYCADCGAGLCNHTEFVETRTRNMPSFRVMACTKCLEIARDEGRLAGREEAADEAQAQIDERDETIADLQAKIEALEESQTTPPHETQEPMPCES